MYEVITQERHYVNQEVSLTTVSFQLPSPDWLLVEESDEWHQVEKLLEELRNTHIQKFRLKLEEKLESP